MQLTKVCCPGVFAGIVAFALNWAPQNGRANVYATNIKLDGSLQSVSTPRGYGTSIGYILNEPATLGVAINILSGTNVVRTINAAPGGPGALRGTNVVIWDGNDSTANPVAVGDYSVSITAEASGFTNWTQTSVDTNSGMPALYPLGIAVDNNTNSLYYGRVVMGCALDGGGTASSVPAAAQKIGLYKMNADGTQADEGWYGNANYTNDDAGDRATGQMPATAPPGFDPMKIRIGDDDRIYWLDDSSLGAIIACDIVATTNRIVINESGYGNMPGYGGYTSDGVGFQEFDVTAATTTNAAVWLCDNDFQNWGVWMFRMTNGAVNTNDTLGTQAVETGGDLASASSGGCTVDANLNVFVGQAGYYETAAYDVMVFTNWSGQPPPWTNGVLPPANSAMNYSMGSAPGEVEWGYGSGVDATNNNDPTFEEVRDVVINSRTHPTLVACPMSAGNDNGNGGGIRVLNAANGSVISVTNGASVQTLTNIDWGQAYTCAAWDNAGNLYAASTTRNLWRVWSPPGTNQATTVAVATVQVVPPPTLPNITGITLAGANVTIRFTGSSTDPASAFGLQSSAAVQGPFVTIPGAVVIGSSGVFSVSTTTNGAATQFYRISR